MDILDIISTVIEFSQKEEEFSDEIKTVRATLESLQLTIKQVDRKQLPGHMTDILNENLEEARHLLKRVSSQKNPSWWTAFKNMLPGSDLQKLKERNQQLIHIINLLNLHLNATKSVKRVASWDDYDDESDMQGSGPTKKVKMSCVSKASDVIFSESSSVRSSSSSRSRRESYARPTSASASNETKKEVAFKLNLLCDRKVGEALSSAENIETAITGHWEQGDQATYEFHRFDFPKLPTDEIKKISKDHATIIATRCRKGRRDTRESTTSSVMVDENEQNISSQMEEEDSYEYKYILRDQSLNGTFYLKRCEIVEGSLEGVEILGNFVTMKKGEEIELEHGDIIGLVVQKPKCNGLIFGFQFLAH